MRFLSIIMGLCAGLLMSCSKEQPKSDHFDGEHFYNLYHTKADEKGFFDFWRWRLQRQREPWPSVVQNTATPHLANQVSEDEVYVTFINHATELIQLKNLTLLTDPIFSERASPLSWYGPKRVRPPGLTLTALPQIDVVIISHNHYDHMDLPSLQVLAQQHNPLFIVPLENKPLLENAGISKIIELDWWQTYTLNENQSITLVPAKHWSKRTFFDTNKALWGSYMVKSHDLKIFFAGDTAISPHIKLIKERLGKVDLALLPIGAYEPRWFMKKSHINPEEAVQIHLALEARWSMGMHFGTFQLTDEGYWDPVRDLKNAMQQYGLKAEQFFIPEHGQTLYFKK